MDIEQAIRTVSHPMGLSFSGIAHAAAVLVGEYEAQKAELLKLRAIRDRAQEMASSSAGIEDWKIAAEWILTGTHSLVARPKL